jgi:hypothetical protein
MVGYRYYTADFKIVYHAFRYIFTIKKMLHVNYNFPISVTYGLDKRGFVSCQGLGIFLFTSASNPALGPTQPPVQWISGALSLGVKRADREAEHPPPSSTEV